MKFKQFKHSLKYVLWLWNSLLDLDLQTNYYQEILNGVDIPFQSGYLSVESYKNNNDSFQVTNTIYNIHSYNGNSHLFQILFNAIFISWNFSADRNFVQSWRLIQSQRCLTLRWTVCLCTGSPGFRTRKRFVHFGLIDWTLYRTSEF